MNGSTGSTLVAPMRRNLQAIGILVSTAAGTFYAETLFPLGDWRWLIVMVAGLAVVCSAIPQG